MNSTFQTELTIPEPDCEEIDHLHLWKLVKDVIKGCLKGNVDSLYGNNKYCRMKTARYIHVTNDVLLFQMPVSVLLMSHVWGCALFVLRSLHGVEEQEHPFTILLRGKTEGNFIP